MNKKIKHRRKYGLVTVYEDDDRYEPLAHMVETFDDVKKAKARALAYAKAILGEYNEAQRGREKELQDFMEFDEFWDEVDNGEKDWFLKDWGYTSTDRDMCPVSIRVICWEE